MEAPKLPEFEFHFDDCIVAFEDGPKSYQDLKDLLPASPSLLCYSRSKETGLFPVLDEASFQRALKVGDKKVSFLLRQEQTD